MEAKMKQQNFSDIEYGNRKRITKREEFLNVMNEIIPWEEWVEYIRPHYPKGERGRPPRGFETMLRMYLLQCWFHLSDEMTEDSIYDSYAMRKFVGVDFMEKQAPDATTLCKFRHVMEANGIGKKLFNAINYVLEREGAMMRGGSIVDATIIDAPSSTKNAEKKRDPEMHQTKKGNEWRFGMKCHAGVDVGGGYAHTVEGTAANVHDITVAHQLLRPDDEVVYGDSAYLGIEKREEISENASLKNIDYRINRRPGKIHHMPEGVGKEWERKIEKQKSAVRCKVEHPFRIVKGIFGYRKTVYRGIEKNMNRLHVLFASANLLMYIWSGRPRDIFAG